MVATTDDHEVLLIEVVVVVAKVADGDHTLTMVLIDLSVDAIGGETGNVGIVGIADLVGHELHHLVLDGVALSILRDLLHVAAVLATL